MPWVAKGPLRVDGARLNPGEPLPDECTSWRSWPHLVAAGVVEHIADGFHEARQAARRAGGRRPAAQPAANVTDEAGQVDQQPALVGDTAAEPAAEAALPGEQSSPEA